eukprot:TRINITY_DN8006_c0_g1_i1.p1 TRINITY_DN8006_c0_g1~~TRINITY_DN8006_c0_g1_i1.p1  ORF type:complete len:144 (-),score=36.85 TRINITY_DN8006_c0_g1_i1:100-531(-)
MTTFANWNQVHQHFPTQSGEWVLIGYTPNSTTNLTYVAHGNGGANSLKQHLNTSTYQYGMIRFEIDKTSMQHTDISAQRDIFFYYSGPDTPILKRGKYLENLGAVEEKFKPVHSKIEIKNKDLLSNQLLIERTNPGSGSKIID